MRVFQELKLEECLKRADPTGLVSVLHREGLSSNSLSRLGQLVTQVRSGAGAMVAMVSDERGVVSSQDLRKAAVHRVLVVMKSLDLLAAKQADLQVLISHGLTSKVSPPEPMEPWGGFTNHGVVSLTLGG